MPEFEPGNQILFKGVPVSWLQAFNQASMNMQTANAIRNQQEWNKLNQERKDMEAFQKALEREDPAAMNDYGYFLYSQGQKEQGYQWFTKAVLKGEAIALANFTWFKLFDGEHDDAITLYDACRNNLKFNVNDYQLANIDSNYILNNLAAGNRVEDAETQWLINGAKTGHLESKFYPAVLAHQAKDFAKRDKILAGLNKGEIKKIHDDLLEYQMAAKGWFKKWSADAFKMLNCLN